MFKVPGSQAARWGWNQGCLPVRPKHKALSVYLQTALVPRCAQHSCVILSSSAPQQADLWCPAHNQALTSASRRLPPSLAQGLEEHQLMAHIDLPSAVTSWLEHGLGNTSLLMAQKNMGKRKRKMTDVCASQRETARGQLSPG